MGDRVARRHRDRAGRGAWLLQLRGQVRAKAARATCCRRQISPNVYELVQKLTLTAHKALGCRGVSRADFRFDDTAGRLGRGGLPGGQYAAGHDRDLAGSRAGRARRAVVCRAGELDGGGGELQQVGTGPDIWWRASQSPAPRPVLNELYPLPHVRRLAHAARAPAQSQQLSLPGSPCCWPALSRRLALLPGVPRWPSARAAPALAEIERVARAGRLRPAPGLADRPPLHARQRHLRRPRSRTARAPPELRQPRRPGRIERLPWVERASIERIVPDRLEVRITERAPFAVWRLGDRNCADRQDRPRARRRAAGTRCPSCRASPARARRDEAGGALCLAGQPPAIARQARGCRARRRAALDAASGRTAHACSCRPTARPRRWPRPRRLPLRRQAQTERDRPQSCRRAR